MYSIFLYLQDPVQCISYHESVEGEQQELFSTHFRRPVEGVYNSIRFRGKML